MKENQTVTVQLVPERLFFVLKDKYSFGREKCNKARIYGDAYPSLMCNVKIHGKVLTIGLHKDRYVSEFRILNRPNAGKEVYTEEDNPIILRIYGGKVTRSGQRQIYRNELYYEMKAKANDSFDPSFAISVVFGELASINTEASFSQHRELVVDNLTQLSPFDLEATSKMKKEFSVCY